MNSSVDISISSYSIGLNTFRAVYIGNGLTIENTRQVPIYERKYAENDNATIDIFDFLIFNIWDIWDDESDSMVVVTANNNDGHVVVRLGDWNITLDDAIDDDGVCYVYEISLYDFRDFADDMEEGKYPITVSYFDADGIEVLNLTSEITLVEGKVNGEIQTFDVVMKDGWKDMPLVDLRVLKTFNGVVLIRLDDDEFTVDLSNVKNYTDGKMPDIFVHYIITFNNLNKEIYEVGEFPLHIDVLEDEEDDGPIWSSDDEFIRFYEPQIAENDNVTIEIDPTPRIIPYEAFIYITANDASGNVTIYVDGWDEPVNISLSDFAALIEKNMK